MTTSSTTAFDLTRDGIIRVAYQRIGIVAGGQDPDASQIAMATDFLSLILRDLENEGVILAKLERTTTTLVTGQAQYTTASDTLDIDGGNPYITDLNGKDLPLTIIQRAEYMRQNDKTIQAQPTMMYIEKTATSVSFFLYPTPDSSWSSVTYPRLKQMTDMDSGDVTTGLWPKYLNYITLQLAADLCPHHGKIALQAGLERKASEAKERARGDDTEHGNVRFVPDYGYRGFSRW